MLAHDVQINTAAPTDGIIIIMIIIVIYITQQVKKYMYHEVRMRNLLQ